SAFAPLQHRRLTAANCSDTLNTGADNCRRTLISGEEKMRVALIPFCLVTLLCLSAMACQNKSASSQNGAQNSGSAGQSAKPDETRDAHSYSNPEQVRVRHVDLDLEALFDRKVLKGTST